MTTRFTPAGLIHEHSEDCSHSEDAPVVSVVDPEMEAAIRQVLIEHSVDVTANQGLHGWRCEYPDSYGGGPCDCFEELVTDLIGAIVSH